MPRKYRVAGITAAAIIKAYETPKYSIMIKAAAPIIGGIICPPVEAEASVPAANSGLNPDFFIIGIVNEPEATVLSTELPDTIAFIALAITTVLAFPPVKRPINAKVRT